MKKALVSVLAVTINLTSVFAANEEWGVSYRDWPSSVSSKQACMKKSEKILKSMNLFKPLDRPVEEIHYGSKRRIDKVEAAGEVVGRNFGNQRVFNQGHTLFISCDKSNRRVEMRYVGTGNYKEILNEFKAKFLDKVAISSVNNASDKELPVTCRIVEVENKGFTISSNIENSMVIIEGKKNPSRAFSYEGKNYTIKVLINSPETESLYIALKNTDSGKELDRYNAFFYRDKSVDTTRQNVYFTGSNEVEKDQTALRVSCRRTRDQDRVEVLEGRF